MGVYKNKRNFWKIHLGWTKSIKEMGFGLMEKFNENKRGRRPWIERPKGAKQGARRKTVVAVDEERK